MSILTETRQPPDRRAPAVALAAAAILAGLWLLAARREGFFEQEQPMDQSAFYCTALDIKRAIAERGLFAFADRWVHADSIHSPLVPTVSALLMILFGEDLLVAQFAAPLFTFLWFLSIVRVVERYWGRAAAYATAALSLVFPVSLIVSRTYLFEYPFAALFAAAGWAFVASERFGKWGPSLLFGLLVGLACVTRMGGHMLLAGLLLVVLVVAWRAPGRWRRLLRLGAGLAIATAVALTWYAPNARAIVDYVYSSTQLQYQYAQTRTNLAFYLLVARVNFDSVVREGPGVPLAIVALLAWIWNSARARSMWRAYAKAWCSAPAVSLAAIFAIDFAIIVAAAQIVGARYCLPIMPITALWVVRGIQGISPPWPRRICSIVAVALAVHHVVALTFTFPVPRGKPGDEARAQAEWLHPLWNHESTLVQLALGIRLGDVATDFRVGDVVDRIANQKIPDYSNVYVVSDHPFFNVNSFRRRALERRLPWGFTHPPQTIFFRDPATRDRVARDLRNSEIVVIREGGTQFTPFGGYEEIIHRVEEPERSPFARAGEPIELGDGSRAIVFRRSPQLLLSAKPWPGLDPANATFRDAAGVFELVLEGVKILPPADANPREVFLCLRSAKPLPYIPTMFLLLPAEGQIYEGPRADGRAPTAAEAQLCAGPGDTCYLLARFRLVVPVPPQYHNSKVTVGLGFAAPERAGAGWRSSSTRMGVASSSMPLTQNTTIVVVGSFDPP